MEPVQTAKDDYAFKVCQCHNCGMTREATFSFDYYPSSLISHNGHPYLICQNCFDIHTAQAFKEPIKSEPEPEPEHAPERRKKKKRLRTANMWETL